MITVLLATHNGSDTMERTLAAMSRLDRPAGGWNLIIVNNASTDDTEACVMKWQDRLPMTYLTEPGLGKSRAINTGLRHATGDLIVMTDDDVLPEKNWLTEWRRVAHALPQCSAFGGAIIPEFEVAPPLSIPESAHGLLYAASPDKPEGEVAPSSGAGTFEISGPNMAIRKSINDQGWRFDEDFLVGKYGLMGEDTDFIMRLGMAGHRIGFAPTARVRHIIHAEQVSKGWIHRRFFRHGQAAFMFSNVKQDPASGRITFQFPWSRIRTALGSALRLALLAPWRNEKSMFRQSISLATDLGVLHQAITLSRRKPTPPLQGK